MRDDGRLTYCSLTPWLTTTSACLRLYADKNYVGMRKLIFIATVSLLLATSASATCPTPPANHGNFFPPFVDWTQDPGCYALSGFISSATVNCFYGGGWSFDPSGLSYAVASFTADQQNIYNASNWSVGSYIEFTSPNASAYDSIELVVVVTHNGVDTRYSIFAHDGTQGSLSGCADQYGVFSAADGDTVSVKIYASNSGNAIIKASYPRIFNMY